jgi:hypothetical protein
VCGVVVWWCGGVCGGVWWWVVVDKVRSGLAGLGGGASKVSKVLLVW